MNGLSQIRRHDLGAGSNDKAWVSRFKKLQREYAKFSDQLSDDGWLSPDTYGKDFAAAENIPAVYMFLASDDFGLAGFHIAYVGMSMRLKSRWATHPTLRLIQDRHHHVKRLFRPVAPCDLRDVERKYIRQFNPPWNLSGKVRGGAI